MFLAAEHQVWVATASFAGSTGGGYAQAAGCSGIWTSGGGVIAQTSPETVAIAHHAQLHESRPPAQTTDLLISTSLLALTRHVRARPTPLG